MIYSLPKEIDVDGVSYPIMNGGDFRTILDITSALNDDELDERQSMMCALAIFYNFNVPKNLQEAIDKMMWFINCGDTEPDAIPQEPLMNWEKDFDTIAPPINRVVGFEIRNVKYLHWWTFIGAYKEIGECHFSYIVGIRSKLRNHQRLDKEEQRYYNENRNKVDLKPSVDEDLQAWLIEK